jgi:N6-L-threonylcarbamoyladenine synthase
MNISPNNIASNNIASNNIAPTASVILGIETSCDETAASIVVDGRQVLSNVVASQVDLHARYGGVVPEIAGRAHIQHVIPVVHEALTQAGFDHAGTGIDLVAVTAGPGLIGSLLVGVSAAKSLSMVWGVPLLGVHHLEAHLLSPFLEHLNVELPLVTLLVSGGHTLITLMETPTTYRVLGGTIDDAAGEAYDKVARYLGLAYPGGPVIDHLAGEGHPTVKFPWGIRDRPYDVSFSGLKTAVVNHVKAHPEIPTADVAASFQESVVGVLVSKTLRAARDHNARGIAIGGGVAANSALRARIAAVCEEEGLRAYIPPRAMCTDNAAMVASAAWWRYPVDGPSGLDLAADPNWKLRGI